MGKFLNTDRRDTINNVVEGFKDRLKNQYYLHNDKSATIVDYYSINHDQSTLDEGLGFEYAQSVGRSPFKYNLIKDFYLYGGISQIGINLDNGDSGLSSDDLDSSTVILPNTIKPVPGDYFKIKYLNRPYLFEIINVNVDTMENGANFYEVQFKYAEKTTAHVDKLVAEQYNFILDNTGTKLNPIVKQKTYNYVEAMDNLCVYLKRYFKELFYSRRVQTFILNHEHTRFYDPFLIEFIMRNTILEGDDEFIYVTQQMSLPRTFSIDYDRTFFRNIENKRITSRQYLNLGYGKHIDQPLSLLSSNKEYYFAINYCKEDTPNIMNKKFIIFDEDLISRIDKNQLFDPIEHHRLNTFKGVFKNVDSNGMCLGSTPKYKGSLFISDGKHEDLSTYKGSIDIIGSSTNSDSYKGSLSISGELERINTFKSSMIITPNISKIDRKNTFNGNIIIFNEFLAQVQKIDNIIIKYFNDIELSIEDIDNLENIEYVHHKDLFYKIPIVIFILEHYIKKQLQGGAHGGI